MIKLLVETVNDNVLQAVMRELWTLRNNYWALPISAEWHDQRDVAMVRIGHGVRLLEVQREAAAKVLDAIGKKMGHGKWAICRGDLEARASKADTLNPEECVEWRSFAGSIKLRSTDDKKAADGLRERDEFFYEFSKQGIIQDPVIAEIVWHSFCRHALHWLLNKQRPVDMLFCILHPMPFRPNWKQIVLDHEIRKHRRGENLIPKKNTVEALVERGVLDELMNEELLFINLSARTIYWSVDVRMTSMWYSMVIELERARKLKLRGGYFAGVVNAVKRALPGAIRMYSNFLSEITRPYPRLRPGKGKGGRFRKAAKSVKAAVIPTRSPVCVATDIASRQPGASLTSEESISYMSELPDIQRKMGNVRDTGGDDLNRAPQPGDATGLPVPDGNSSEGTQ